MGPRSAQSVFALSERTNDGSFALNKDEAISDFGQIKHVRLDVSNDQEGNRVMSFEIIAKEGTHVMISDGARYAVIEQRADQFYNCHGGSRSGTPIEDLDKVATLLDDADWADKATAQARLDQIATRGNDLAQRML